MLGRVTRTPSGTSMLCNIDAVASPGISRLVAKMTSSGFSAFTRSMSSAMRSFPGTNAVDWRDRPMQHVVLTSKLTGSIERQHIQRFLYDANDRVSGGIGADRAWLSLGDVEAARAEKHALLYREDRFCERDRFLTRAAQDRKRQPRRALGADSWETAEFFDEIGYRLDGNPT